MKYRRCLSSIAISREYGFCVIHIMDRHSASVYQYPEQCGDCCQKRCTTRSHNLLPRTSIMPSPTIAAYASRVNEFVAGRPEFPVGLLSELPSAATIIELGAGTG